MAIYEGARVQAGLLPRRRPSRAVRARRGWDGIGLTLALIVAAFLLGIVYLNQVIMAAGTGYDLDQLRREQLTLRQQIQSLEGEVVRYAAEPVVVQRAQQAGLDSLGDPLRLTGR
jgi:hypothetical protein